MSGDLALEIVLAIEAAGMLVAVQATRVNSNHAKESEKEKGEIEQRQSYFQLHRSANFSTNISFFFRVSAKKHLPKYEEVLSS